VVRIPLMRRTLGGAKATTVPRLVDTPKSTIKGLTMKKVIAFSILCILAFSCRDKSTDLSDIGSTFTAAVRLSAVNTYTESCHLGVRLFRVFTSNVDTNGKASQWSYCYVDTSGSHPLYYFHATSTQVTYDSTSALYVGPSVITLHWFDSDSAIIFAELNGGSAYRSEHPDYWISANLGQIFSPNPITIWSIYYHNNSNSIMLGVRIDANCGAIIGQTR